MDEATLQQMKYLLIIFLCVISILGCEKSEVGNEYVRMKSEKVKCLEPNQVWRFEYKQDDPFKMGKIHRARVIELKDGWVLYQSLDTNTIRSEEAMSFVGIYSIREE